jgi:Protein of unknown function (DUF2795)
VERGSTQHSPRVDEEMERETRSVVQGAPVGARVEEAREQEGPGGDEPVPDARIEGDRPSASPMLSAREVEGRSELARHLEPGRFPATRAEVLGMARELHAPDAVITQLDRLPPGRYETFGEVWEALGGQREPRRGAPSVQSDAPPTQPGASARRRPVPDLVALPVGIAMRAADLGIKGVRAAARRLRGLVSR